MKRWKLALPVVAGMLIAQSSFAAGVDFDVSSLSGSWSWGDTQWNDVFNAGFVNDTADLSTVNSILHGAYAYTPAGAKPNALYNWDGGQEQSASVTFALANATTFSNLSILSSRSYSSATQVLVDYSANGGHTWTNAVTTTTGALGWADVGTLSTQTEALNIALGGVVGDELRLTVDGDQINLHTVAINGITNVSTVPEANASILMLAGLGVLAAKIARRRRA